MSFTIPVRTLFTLTWTLTNAQGDAINNAAVTATLYAGRSPINPEGTPGTPVPPIVNLTLNYIPASAGKYSAAAPATIDPPLDGAGYVLVIDATIGGNQIYHTEQPATVETAGSNLDLTTVDLVKAWMPGPQTSTTDDAILQSCITAWSTEFLRRTGLGDQSGDYTQSPFNSICTWDETYDGSGTTRLMLRNRPVKTVISLIVNGIAVPMSSGYPSQGWVLDASRKSISMRGGVAGWGWGSRIWNTERVFTRAGFPQGNQNISIQYIAGYATTPQDIIQTANEIIYLNYKQRPYYGELSRSVAGGGGSITFMWNVPPRATAVIDSYTRTL